MATKKKAAVVEAEPQDAGQDKPTADEAMAERYGWRTQGLVPLGRIWWLKHPDYPGFEVGFRLNVAYGLRAGVDIPDDGYGGDLRKLAAIAPAFRGWAFVDPLTGQPIPEPDPQDLGTYRVFITKGGPLFDVGEWLQQGFAQAIQESLKNS